MGRLPTGQCPRCHGAAEGVERALGIVPVAVGATALILTTNGLFAVRGGTPDPTSVAIAVANVVSLLLTTYLGLMATSDVSILLAIAFDTSGLGVGPLALAAHVFGVPAHARSAAAHSPDSGARPTGCVLHLGSKERVSVLPA